MPDALGSGIIREKLRYVTEHQKRQQKRLAASTNGSVPWNPRKLKPKSINPPALAKIEAKSDATIREIWAKTFSQIVLWLARVVIVLTLFELCKYLHFSTLLAGLASSSLGFPLVAGKNRIEP